MATLALCIPAYNAENYLPRLLQSAKDQPVPFDEILVYNDCSTDQTAEVAARFGAKVMNGSINKGCSFGKNQLAMVTTCDWLHFHDADDDLLPDFTTSVHKWINAHGDKYDVLLLNFRYVDFNTGASLGTANHDIAALHADPLKYAINHKIVNFGVYKREAFLQAGGFDLDEKVLYNEDNAFHQRLAKQGLKFDYLPHITCINYRYNASMSASNRFKCARANFHVLEGTVSTHGNIYPQELGAQLWKCSTNLAAEQDWDYVKRALALCKKLGFQFSADDGPLFSAIGKIAPFPAFWFREKMIRLLKPSLRKNG